MITTQKCLWTLVDIGMEGFSNFSTTHAHTESLTKAEAERTALEKAAEKRAQTVYSLRNGSTGCEREIPQLATSVIAIGNSTTMISFEIGSYNFEKHKQE